ncbi:hypothetical protein N7532_011852 [Penicillium argentinense]|uniref:Enoyl reductase (ER) domain-containing protein n=1 Tax=Penicillium argentinense TaxID=1131581 RepID=A0A9W9EJD1_9EURO|nr:uncharacterized protein N7532_011852 [Penicillium argentinense]KAJ5082809.1 hypothetical protein N7532_011852 [Penicillium argentinense]
MELASMNALQLKRASETDLVKSEMVSVPIPKLKPDHALVHVKYASIQPSDRLNAQGLFPSTTYPRIPGRDYSGTVVDISSNSEESKSWIGKNVYGSSGSSLGFDTDGTHAQYCLIPQNALVEIPTTMSLLQAATVGVPFTTAHLCLTKARVSENDVVLVLGANGAVGSAAAQMARAMGCKRVLTAVRRPVSNPDIVLVSDSPGISLSENISTLTSDKGIDVVIDTVGDMDLMSAAVEKLAFQGRYIWIAAPRGVVSRRLSFDVFQGYRKEITLLGCNSVARTLEDTAGYLRSVNTWIDRGLLKALPEETFGTVKLDEAIEDGYKKTAQKVVIDMS